ncbi:MAG: DAHL domain-containing protein [bacterium]
MRYLLTILLWSMGLVGALLLTSAPQLDRAGRLERAATLLRDVQFTEVQLDRELMRARGATDTNYDELAHQTSDLEAAADLAADAVEEGLLKEPPAALGDIARAVAAKRQAIEDFKSDHAIMRNSMAYLPTLITEVTAEVEARPAPPAPQPPAAPEDPAAAPVAPAPVAPAPVAGPPPIEPAERDRLRDELRALWQDVLIYGQQGGAERGEAIRARARALAAAAPPGFAARFGLLARHADSLVDHRSAVDRHLETYFQSRTAPAHDQLQGLLADARSEALANAGARRNLRLVLIGLLVLLGVNGLWSLRRRTMRLEEGLEARTLALEAANAELEAEVEARRRTEAELAEALKKARAATQAKADFLANMSHEIRTPMNGVVGMTTLLLDTHLDAEQMQYVSSIERSGTALLTVINDILDFSKIEAGRMDIESRPFDVHQVVHDVAGVLLPAAQGKDIRLEARIADDVPQYALGDAVRLRQILLNLAGNAVKFTKEGKVSIEISRRSADLLDFTVADTGIGIAGEKLRYIFDAFSQADSSTTRKFGGTGLGLAICRRLVELMRGEIQVESQVGRGSRFRVSLPLAETAPPALVDDRNDARPSDRALKPVAEQVIVLLAEDNLINQRVATRLLEKLGCEVHTVDDGTGAVEQALARSFDLVFMDCQMPRMDGYAATRTLRTQGYDRPIVAMTANAMPGDRERCLDAGMDDYIPKPIARGELERVLRTWAPTQGAAAAS